MKVNIYYFKFLKNEGAVFDDFIQVNLGGSTKTLEAKYKQALIDYNNAVDKELKTATINTRAKKVMDAQEAFDDFLYQEQDDSGEMPEPLVRMPTEEDDFNYIGPSKD